MSNSESNKRQHGQVKKTQKRTRKPGYARVNAAGVESIKGSESTQEEKYRMLIQNIPCAVYTAYPGKAGPTTFISNKWEDWTGYSPEELYQNPEAWPKCIHPDDREYAVNTYIEACRDRIAYNLKYRIVHKDTGQLRYVRDQGHLSKDEKDAVVRVDGIVTDITELKKANNELEKYRDQLEELVKNRTAELTSAYETLKAENKERKRAEQALHEIEREKSTVLENLSDLIVYRDRDMVTLWASKSMANWHGMSQEQIIGRVCYKARYGRDEPCKECHVVEAVESKQRQELEMQLPDERYWHVTVNPVLSDSGQVIGTIEVSQDITERKKADEEFRKSRDILEKTFTSLDSAVFILDSKNPPIIIDCNPAATRIFGYGKEEMLGRTTEFLHAGREKLLEFQKALKQSIEEQGGLSFFEFKMQRKDGRVFPSEHSVRSLMDDKGRMIGWISVIRDITERKQSEEALRETTNLLETIFEHTHMLVACLDSQFNFVRVNRAYAEADEREPSFFPGKNHFDLYPNEENEVIFRRVVETGIPSFAYAKPFEYAEHPGRGISYWDWSLVPIKNQQGIVSALVLTLADVTARKCAEESLKASEGKLNAMLQSISDHMSMMDKDLNILWANDVAKRKFGDDIIGKKCYEVYHGRQSPCEPHPCLSLRAFQDGEVHEHDTEFVDKEGNTGWFHCVANVALRNEEGEATAVLETSTDITERVLAELALQESEEHFRAIYENALVGLYRTTPDGRILMANPALVQMLGYSSFEELAQLNLEEEGFSRDCQRSVFKQRVEAEDQIVGLESRWMRRDGTTLFVRESARTVRDKNGEILYYEGTVADLTERRKAEEELRIREQKLRALLNAPTESAILADTEGAILDINRIAAQRLGKSMEELIGMGIYEYLPADIAEYRINQAYEVVRTGKPVRFQDECEGRYYDTNIYPVFDDEGKVSSLAIFSGDITEHKRAEEALKESEEKFRSLAEQSPNMIFINKKGKIVYGNKKCEEVMGYTREELCSDDFDFRTLIAPESLDVINDFFTSHLRGEDVQPYDYTIINKDGERIEAINASKLIQYEGQTAILGIVTDITERKRSEHVLRESEERLKILFESAPDSIYVIDSEGRFVDGNKVAFELVGFARDEVIGKSLAELGLLSAEQLSKAEANLKKVASGKLSGPNEYILKRKDGSHVSIEVRTFPVKIEGKMLTLGIARDITINKRTEKELLEHQAKLKSLASQLSLTEERERHRLATDLHDQISQSLVISKIKLDQLRKSSISAEFNEPLEDICNCLGQIIDDTRALTFDLSYPILYELGFEAAVAEWLTDQIQEKHRIKTEFEDDGHQKPLDDDIRVLLFRNVRELLINVVKHSQANKVRVSIRKVKDNICVSVEDDGVGFDPVEVTSLATKRAEFGLFSIRERLEQLGGLIEIDSGIGHGSEITMTAPLKYDNSTDRT